MNNDIELMRIQAEVLYQAQADGQLLQVNEPAAISNNNELRPELPRLFWGYTKLGSVLRYDRLPESTLNNLKTLLDSSLFEGIPVSNEIKGAQSGWPELLMKVRDTFEQSIKIKREWRGPAYLLSNPSLDKKNNYAYITFQLKIIDHQNAALLEETFSSLYSNWMYRQPCIAAVVNHQAISVCYSARQTERAAEAGVETLPFFRGKGCAAAVTAKWAEMVHHSGKLALYSTSWDNAASRKVAERLQGYMYGLDFSIYTHD